MDEQKAPAQGNVPQIYTTYGVSASDEAEIERRFTYHAPKTDQVDRYAILRDNHAKKLAYSIHRLCPDSRERSLALTYLETAVMFANAAIARRE